MLRILLVLVLLVATSAGAESFPARVVVVLDGDTVMVLAKGRGGRPIKIRLAGIDAPEKDQPWGLESKRVLSEKVLHREVSVEKRAYDKYGRMVARLLLGRQDVCAEMVREGYAWEYSFGHADRGLAAMEKSARSSELGLWQDRHQTPPWQWRKAHRAESSVRFSADDFVCGRKHLCKQMRSCDEAHYFLTHCRVRGLDADSDGVPCPELCR